MRVKFVPLMIALLVCFQPTVKSWNRGDRFFLIGISSIICLLTIFIHYKQNKQKEKKVEKAEREQRERAEREQRERAEKEEDRMLDKQGRKAFLNQVFLSNGIEGQKFSIDDVVEWTDEMSYANIKVLFDKLFTFDQGKEVLNKKCFASEILKWRDAKVNIDYTENIVKEFKIIFLREGVSLVNFFHDFCHMMPREIDNLIADANEMHRKQEKDKKLTFRDCFIETSEKNKKKIIDEKIEICEKIYGRYAWDPLIEKEMYADPSVFSLPSDQFVEKFEAILL